MGERRVRRDELQLQPAPDAAVPYRPSLPVNRPDPSGNIARTGAGVTPIEKSAHYGHWQY
ncbi:MAG: hypothetical protein ACRDN0_36740 [Trebonia sp.]